MRDINEHYNENRKLYMDGKMTHDDFYCWLADRLGVTIADLNVTTDKLLASKDEHFNDISLTLWDRNDSYIRLRAQREGKRSWSLSDSVCVAKAVARRWVNTAQSVAASR